MCVWRFKTLEFVSFLKAVEEVCVYARMYVYAVWFENKKWSGEMKTHIHMYGGGASWSKTKMPPPPLSTAYSGATFKSTFLPLIHDLYEARTRTGVKKILQQKLLTKCKFIILLRVFWLKQNILIRWQINHN